MTTPQVLKSNVNTFFKKAKDNVNNRLAENVIETALKKGVKEFCLAAASRNASLVYALANTPEIKTYYWSEERSAAFFALGRAKATGRPVAVIVTSGTAAAELLPAAMVAHYSAIPLLLVTADRPRRYRGTGAPQTAEQNGLYSYYVQYMQDVALNENCCLEKWVGTGPAHINVCLEEPSDAEAKLSYVKYQSASFIPQKLNLQESTQSEFIQFLDSCTNPLVVIGDLRENQREAAVQFLLWLNAPLYAEGFSGLREEPRLHHLRITSIERVWERSSQNGYLIDAVIRIGSIPTTRLWRDLEEKEGTVNVFSISEIPFSGLSWNTVHQTNLNEFFKWAVSLNPKFFFYESWQKADQTHQEKLFRLYLEEPLAEVSLIHELSKILPVKARVFLGNSLPVREWDSSATWQSRCYDVNAVRGVNGIDGQIATFLGLCSKERENWAIIGDLTALYDMTSPWILNQMPGINATILIVNNSGGQIFAPMYTHAAFLNTHHLNFKPLADMWGWEYERWTEIPQEVCSSKGGRIIELIPDLEASNRFRQKSRML